MKDTADVLHVGAQISIPMEDGTHRRCEVVSMDEYQFRVKFYTPDGMGPHYCMLPHAMLPGNTIHRNLNPDDRGGRHEHYMKFHPDFKE